MCFQTPIAPEISTSTSEILDFASFGLSDLELQRTSSRLRDGLQISGDQFPNSRRLGNCYYYPDRSRPDYLNFIHPSKRRFMALGGWTHGDSFVVPFWQSPSMIGQIILDDPNDGKIPSHARRQRLEEVANIAAVALRDACDLEALNEEHGLLRFFADYAMTGLLVVQDQNIRYANDQMVQILGYDKTDLSRMNPWWNFVHPDDRPLLWTPDPTPMESKTRIRAIRKDGRVLWLVSCVHSVLYGDTHASAYQFYDVTDRIKAEELLKEKALRDPLTGFRNRGYFDDAIQIELQRSKRYRREFTLAMADLANFKQVNDQLGHQEGDRILAGIAGVVREGLRDSDWIVRYGGDEFLLVLPETGSSLDGLISRLTQSVDAWCEDHCSQIAVGIDFGWATWTAAAQQTIPDLIRTADAMLYERKAQHKENQNRSVSASADSGGSETR
ncbi:sensor domain-containing diguanylate cyclase [Candidatus Bipolaricaulota bacterium]|nr:sensor domain-containing diguanylate cyclase [Candidatus Bipolaricaulota bacterium]